MTRINLDGLIHKTALINDLNFHYVEAGEGPLVVLIHGFPEFWYSWRHQIPALVEAGYRVIAPDMRGYNLTDSPAKTSNYTVDLLASDVVALIQHAGEQRSHVVGHDWGAAIAWQLAMRYPQHLDQLAILNGPHPKVFGKGFWRPSQSRQRHCLARQSRGQVRQMPVRQSGARFRCAPLPAQSHRPHGD